MIEISLREVCKSLLSVFNLDPLSTELLHKVIAGSEKADDYEEIFKSDKFFTETICQQASKNMKTSVVSGLGHGVVVVGQTNVRNMVLGHTISRIFSPHADSQFTDITDAGKNLKYSIKAEEHAKKCENEYAGMAFAGGYIFDIFSRWIAQDTALTERLGPFIDGLWKHSLKTATLAWALATHERVLISHRKIIFTSALLHDIGKLGLALTFPKEYEACIEKMKSERDQNLTDDAYEVTIEREHFDLSHAEIGSAIVFQTKFLSEIETEVDFHHDSTLLKTRNPDAFLGAAVVNIADRIAWLMDRKPSFGMEELQEILKPHGAYFPLKSVDVMQLFAEVRSKALLAT